MASGGDPRRRSGKDRRPPRDDLPLWNKPKVFENKMDLEKGATLTSLLNAAANLL